MIILEKYKDKDSDNVKPSTFSSLPFYGFQIFHQLERFEKGFTPPSENNVKLPTSTNPVL